MGDTTGIAWSDSTWNPWIGCRKVSAGCAHCYAEKLVNGRMGGEFRTVRRTTSELWSRPYRWNRETNPGSRPRLVFTCSLSDWFIEEADAWRPEAWTIVRATPNLAWQILTKRPERIAAHLPPDWGDSGYPNVWLGVSGEDLEKAKERGSILARIPARVRFLSAEPWLQAYSPSDMRRYLEVAEMFDWVIVGGESGPACRPMDERSALALINAVALSERAVYLKQLGGPSWSTKRDHEQAILDGRTWTELPLGLTPRREA